MLKMYIETPQQDATLLRGTLNQASDSDFERAESQTMVRGKGSAATLSDGDFNLTRTAKDKTLKQAGNSGTLVDFNLTKTKGKTLKKCDLPLAAQKATEEKVDEVYSQLA